VPSFQYPNQPIKQNNQQKTNHKTFHSTVEKCFDAVDILYGLAEVKQTVALWQYGTANIVLKSVSLLFDEKN
jgi:hypothetical protein